VSLALARIAADSGFSVSQGIKVIAGAPFVFASLDAGGASALFLGGRMSMTRRCACGADVQQRRGARLCLSCRRANRERTNRKITDGRRARVGNIRPLIRGGVGVRVRLDGDVVYRKFESIAAAAIWLASIAECR
jgi:hypothetical protein